MQIRKKGASLVAMLTGGLLVSACGARPDQRSRLLEEPSAPTTAGSGDAAGADVTINPSDYFRPRESAKSVQITDETLAKLPQQCAEGEQPDTSKVALTVDGRCKLFTKEEAKAKLEELAQALGAYGADLSQEVATAGDLPERDQAGETVADPKVSLETVVAAQINLGSNGPLDPNAPQMALTGYALDDNRWGGALAPRTFGSDQFGLTTAAHMYVQHVDGVGIDGALSADGKVFGASVSMMSGSLTGTALDGERAGVSANFAVMGYTILNRQLQEPEWRGAGDLATLNRSKDGNIRFSLGPIPFNVRWIVTLTGGVPWQITARVTSPSASLTPNIGSTASVEGGPNIVVAAAGVGGSFTLLTATLTNTAEASIRRQQSQNNFCYKVSSSLDFTNMLGGRLYAFGEIGWPNRTFLGRPLGWRGDLDFVQWDGMRHTIPIYSSGAELTCVQII